MKSALLLFLATVASVLMLSGCGTTWVEKQWNEPWEKGEGPRNSSTTTTDLPNEWKK